MISSRRLAANPSQASPGAQALTRSQRRRRHANALRTKMQALDRHHGTGSECHPDWPWRLSCHRHRMAGSAVGDDRISRWVEVWADTATTPPGRAGQASWRAIYPGKTQSATTPPAKRRRFSLLPSRMPRMAVSKYGRGRRANEQPKNNELVRVCGGERGIRTLDKALNPILP